MAQIRSLTPEDDFDAVGRVYAASWQATYRGLLPESYLCKLTHHRWSALLRADPASTLAVFDAGNEVLGAATVCFSRERGREGYGEVVSIYMRPDCVRQGYGCRLMQAVLRKLRADGCENVCLWALERNTRAEGFYRHMGFALTGEMQTENFGGETVKLHEYARSLIYLEEE